ncbi:MAG TPA: peptidylprolyl isomerase [Prolixibacteraceae bacterium]|nr:peptidylprolyl isomerase [Prolixibacteraceae bacterium]
MRNILILGLLLTTLAGMAPAQEKKGALVTIGKTAITPDEFHRIYERNNANIQDPENKKTAREYLELFINFKLKVMEAMHLGMDTVQAFKTELEGYRNELSTPYLTNITFNDQLVKETYQRMLKEVNASHLLVEVPDGASPADTLAARKKIMEIREEILGGLDFGDAAVTYSQDPSAQANKGDLGWFTVFQMVYPFEEAAYTTPVGEVSMPVRTRFGYHLLKVNGIREAQGEIHVAHIMKIYAPDASPAQKEKARQAADSLYHLLEGGASFTRLARENSDDERSAANNGELPWFSRNRMIPAFADPAFALSNDGDYTRPIDSGFGFHIIKRLEYRPLPAFDQVKRELEERIKRDGERSEHSREAFVADLKNEYHFTRSEERVERVLAAGKTWISGDSLVIPADFDQSQLLFTFANQKITAREWADHLKTIPGQQLRNDPGMLPRYYHAWENETLIRYEESRLEEKHPDFRSLLQEYHDGILLFNISERQIWQKAASDSVGLAAFYETNKGKYLWPERYQGSIIRCASPQLKEEAETLAESGVDPGEIQDVLRLPDGALTISRGIWEKGENPVIDYYLWEGSLPADWNETTGFITGEKMAPAPKALDESRGYHISDYQQYLEEQWVRELRRKYPVKINKKLVKQLADG